MGRNEAIWELSVGRRSSDLAGCQTAEVENGNSRKRSHLLIEIKGHYGFGLRIKAISVRQYAGTPRRSPLFRAHAWFQLPAPGLWVLALGYWLLPSPARRDGGHGPDVEPDTVAVRLHELPISWKGG